MSARRQADQALVASDGAQEVSTLTGFDPSRFKPSLAFLRKVEAGQVKRVRGYTRRKGGYDRFVGGVKQWEKHYRAGFVTRAPMALLGQPGVVELTEKDLAAIRIEARRGGTTKIGPTRSARAGAEGIAQTTPPSQPRERK